MRGIFTHNRGSKGEVVTPNIVVQEGEESFLKMMLQADIIDVPAGGDFFIGMCDYTPAFNDGLINVINEPTAGVGGYARQAVERDSVGWPDISTVNGVFRGRSKVVTFTATGADYDKAFSRLFLCNVVTGTAGILYAVSGALATPIILLDGQSHLADYEIYLNG